MKNKRNEGLKQIALLLKTKSNRLESKYKVNWGSSEGIFHPDLSYRVVDSSGLILFELEGDRFENSK